MSALARNLAESMALDAPCFEFGETFHYVKVYFSSLHSEYVTVENFVEGTFEKFINNNGDICAVREHSSEIGQKAEAFVHYTYRKSNEELMVTDIQGVKYQLCDPEVATDTLTDSTDGSIY